MGFATDSMGFSHPVMQLDRAPAPRSTYGMPPPMDRGSLRENFFNGVVQPWTPLPLVVHPVPYGPLPFDPHTPVPGNMSGTEYVSWPVPGGR